MKYSYSPTTGFASTPTNNIHTRMPSLSQPEPSLRPANQYNYPAAQPPPPTSSPPLSASYYGSFFGSQPQQPYSPPGYPPRPPPTPAGHAQKLSTGYTPVAFDSPYSGGYPPEQFYGSLIDAGGRPSEVFSRLADSFFFWLDQSCDIPGLRNTGLIEPAKYAWMLVKMGDTPETAQLVQQYLSSFYETASIPHSYARTPQGQVPVIDRRGWLHMAVFEARATPQESHTHWTKSLTLWALVDPTTGTPFPTPLPRSALPTYADPRLSQTYATWRAQVALAVQRARSDAMVQSITNASKPSFNPYAFGAGAAGAGGFGASGFGADGFGTSSFGGAGDGTGGGGGGGGDPGNGGGSGGGDDGNSHATVLDTVNTFGTLANTVLGMVGNNSNGGSNGAGGGSNAPALGGGLGGNAFDTGFGGNAFGTGFGGSFGSTGFGF